MNDPVSYFTAFTIGLLGGAHCIGMCGGIMNALSFGIQADKRSGGYLSLILLSYNLGRIASYMTAGAIIGAISWWAQDALAPTSSILRYLAGIMLIAMGLYLAGWWSGLRYLEQLGNQLWRLLEPYGKRLMPVTSPGQALFLGAVWGWLPCGMVYSVLTWSATAADWMQSVLIMLCFGLGTLPVMFVTGHMSVKLKSIVQQNTTRRVAAVLMIAYGIWTIVGATMYSGAHNHNASHEHMQHHEHNM